MTGMRKATIAVGVPMSLVLFGLLLIASCAPLPAARIPSAPPPTGAATADAAPITLAAVFAPWYGYDASTGNRQGGLGSYRWNNVPDTADAFDAPYHGSYCSADPKSIEWQFDGLERARARRL